jgi:hypothetical protein
VLSTVSTSSSITDFINTVEYEIKQVFIYVTMHKQAFSDLQTLHGCCILNANDAAPSDIVSGDDLESNVGVSTGHVTYISAGRACTNGTLSTGIRGFVISFRISRI